MKNEYDPTKVLNINIGQSCTERLIALLGGYSEGLMSLLIEPEAVTDFLNRFSDYFIELVDKVCDRYPVKMITFHDDWGTSATRFSPSRSWKTSCSNQPNASSTTSNPEQPV
jgi:uroporphyrinogen-III decarboxylase